MKLRNCAAGRLNSPVAWSMTELIEVEAAMSFGLRELMSSKSLRNLFHWGLTSPTLILWLTNNLSALLFPVSS
jgi:hypothetical protein